MVYPVSAQVQQYAPASVTQPGIAEQQREQTKVEDSTKPSGSETARSEASETRNNGRAEDSRARADEARERRQDSGSVFSSSSRGTQLDITA